jgi:hypothetical protein
MKRVRRTQDGSTRGSNRNARSGVEATAGPLVHPRDSHFGETEEIVLSLKEPWCDDHILNGQRQVHSARLPIIRLELDESSEDEVIKLTLDEAQELVMALERLIDAAWKVPDVETAQEVSASPLPLQGRT